MRNGKRNPRVAIAIMAKSSTVEKRNAEAAGGPPAGSYAAAVARPRRVLCRQCLVAKVHCNGPEGARAKATKVVKLNIALLKDDRQTIPSQGQSDQSSK